MPYSGLSMCQSATQPSPRDLSQWRPVCATLTRCIFLCFTQSSLFFIQGRPMYVSECDPDKKGPVFKYQTGMEKKKLFVKGTFSTVWKLSFLCFNINISAYLFTPCFTIFLRKVLSGRNILKLYAFILMGKNHMYHYNDDKHIEICLARPGSISHQRRARKVANDKQNQA